MSSSTQPSAGTSPREEQELADDDGSPATDDGSESNPPSDGPSDPPSDSTEIDSDPTVDSDGAVDSDVPTLTTDSADTDGPVIQRPPPPTSLGAGFTQLTTSFWQQSPFVLDPGQAGTDAWPESTWVLAADLFEDGVMDVYFATMHEPGVTSGRFMGQVYQLDPTTGSLTHNPDMTLQLRGQVVAQLQAFVDLDGDGDTDIVRGGTDSAIGLIEGQDITWYDAPLPSTREYFSGMSTFALLDLDLDGWLDMGWSGDDCRRSPHIDFLPVVRTGLASWTSRTEMADQEPAGSPYVAMGAPLGPDHEPHLVVLGRSCQFTVDARAFQRISHRDDEGYPVWSHVTMLADDAAFRLRPSSVGGEIARLQPMGATVTDLDLDGGLDLSITVADDYLQMFRSVADDQLADWTLDVDLQMAPGQRGTPQLPWDIVPLDLDMDGRPDLTIAHGDDAGATWQVPHNGPYPVRSHWNDGMGGFADITDLTNLGVMGDWHTLTVFDIDGDADPDLGLGGFGFEPHLFRNDIETGNEHIALRLRGTTSNHLGLGAVVQIEAGALPTQTRLVGESASSHVVSAPTVYAGLGANTQADTVRVRWPTGYEQVVTGLAAGQTHEIVEPALITLSEADRHVPADGISTIDVVVTPRAPDGTLQAAAVTIESPWGDATFAGPSVEDQGVWTRTLVAPASAGSSVVVVTIDGEEVFIKPRVWWD